jgi:outer membrane protein OmpA-like peptidoglycan-associated protein
MKPLKLNTLFLLIIMIEFFSHSLSAQSLVSPFEGSTEIGVYEARFDLLTLLVDPIDDQKNPSTLDVEGALISTIYQKPENVSQMEIYRSYEKILKNADFDILLSCKEGVCNAKKNVKAVYGYPNKQIENRKYDRRMLTSAQTYLTGWGNHYISATKTTSDKTYYVMIIISNQKKLYSVDVLEVENMEEGTVELDPKLLKDKLESEGKVVLQGIYFETGKDVITDASTPALKVIAAYLKDNSSLSFYVVGHTDNTGNLTNNIALSKNRASAVIAALKNLGVNTTQLIGNGVGPYAPASTNLSDTGRTKNRRVELVLQAK